MCHSKFISKFTQFYFKLYYIILRIYQKIKIKASILSVHYATVDACILKVKHKKNDSVSVSRQITVWICSNWQNIAKQSWTVEINLDLMCLTRKVLGLKFKTTILANISLKFTVKHTDSFRDSPDSHFNKKKGLPMHKYIKSYTTTPVNNV